MAFLYIDPGTGAMVWQVLLAGFFGLIFYGKKIKTTLFSWRERKERKAEVTKGE